MVLSQLEARNAERQQRKEQPHLWNMNADSALSGVVAYFLNQGDTVVGNGKAPGRLITSSVDIAASLAVLSIDVKTDVVLTSVNILPKHATITRSEAGLFILKHSKRATILVNGVELGYELVGEALPPETHYVDSDELQQLHHFDRVLLAPGQLYCLSVPAVTDAGVHDAPPTYEEAQVGLLELCNTFQSLNRWGCRTR